MAHTFTTESTRTVTTWLWRHIALTCVVAWLLCCSAAVAQQVVVENPQALPVIDRANLLTPEQEADLSNRLKGLAGSDGTQVAVLTVPTTGDEDIFTFAQRTASAWGIGQEEENSGALFVVASEDRKSRIHVGYGLEGRLTDALSKRILSTEVSPEFRKGDFYQGISKGVDSIIAAVKGEYQAPPEERGTSGGGGEGMFWFIIIALILFFLWNAFRGGRGGPRGGHRRGAMLPNVWTTGGGSSSGWGHSGGDFGGGGGGGFGGGFGGGSFGGGGASDSW